MRIGRFSFRGVRIEPLTLTRVAAEAQTPAVTLDELYHKDVLRLAARASGAGRLPAPAATVTLSNPICGDQVTVDVVCEGARISDLAFDVKACVLCQASASILGETAQGETAQTLAELSRALSAMLKKSAAPPRGKFSAYAALAPVAAHPSRHTCVLLPLDALREALASCAAA
jgi:SUF system NifU family Fe-S assembly protein